jgi:hypothetical protein
LKVFASGESPSQINGEKSLPNQPSPSRPDLHGFLSQVFLGPALAFPNIPPAACESSNSVVFLTIADVATSHSNSVDIFLLPSFWQDLVNFLAVFHHRQK